MRRSSVAILLGACSCGYPAFTSALRTNFDGNSKIETSCSRLERNDIPDTVSKATKDGWRLAYVSEYTSTATSSFPSLICFERVPH
jgi:hypothetical protein